MMFFRQWWLLWLILFNCSVELFCQSLAGKFSQMPGVDLELIGYDNLDTLLLGKCSVSEDGSFLIEYPNNYKGMAYLKAMQQGDLLVYLSGESVEISGKHFKDWETININSGKSNQFLFDYLTLQGYTEQALSAIAFLEKVYPQLDSSTRSLSFLRDEKERIAQLEQRKLQEIQFDNYLPWYLTMKKLIGSVSNIAQYRTAEIPSAIEKFRQVNLLDERFRKSGLFQSIFESHFWLIENSGLSIDSTFQVANQSIDAILNQLSGDSEKFNSVSALLFRYLEQRSLFNSASYLATKYFSNDNCVRDIKLEAQMESYRSMRQGMKAKEFILGPVVKSPGYLSPVKKMSEITSTYRLIVFGESGCSACSALLPKLVTQHPAWKKNDLEIVYCSLDIDAHLHQKFTQPFPFVSSWDGQGWNGKNAMNYHLYSTPTMYILDRENTILFRPSNIDEVGVWLKQKKRIKE